jgi:hypothetical protein
MPAWSLKVTAGGAAAAEWFLTRFARARALMTAAGVAAADNFDTIIAEDFGQTVTSELVDVVGVADASPVSAYNGGVVAVTVGDAVVAPSSARLQLTSPPSHVQALNERPWYVASLVRVIRPGDDELGDTAIDAVGLWGDADNRIGLGVLGNASGGSITNWVGYAVKDAGFTTVLGPALDPEESPVWHLFEAWFFDEELHFYIDGEEFASTLAADDVPGLPATLGMTIQRDDVGDVAAPNYDKVCAIVRSPRVGEID